MKSVIKWTKSIYTVEVFEDGEKFLVKVSNPTWEKSFKYGTMEEAEERANFEIKFCREVLKL